MPIAPTVHAATTGSRRLRSEGSGPIEDFGKVVEYLCQVVGEARHLLLLESERHQSPVATALQVEDTLTPRTERADREELKVVEGKGFVHEGARAVRSSPVELTVKTTGPSGL